MTTQRTTNRRHKSAGRTGLAMARPGCHEPSSRRGITLLVAVVCLLVVMLFSGAVVKKLILHRAAARLEQEQMQSFLFAESAAGRTKANLLANGDFSGETWRVSHDGRTGVATIQIEKVPDQPEQRLVRIEVLWPDDPIARVRRFKELVITLPQRGNAS